ncbi:putative membrane protein SpoIIM required for sporulation [Actinoplanes lutulentus]|uniref:Putative membrane protein SpoIIM required for sporulation n=1 Tax=Actinoplanes lutulentus TaxID=1287878 RepID=A0A327YY59_9ACTN|nr:stage II sporulation protein M [Actinoplanes lutulentus]MBB2948953.1 putative membrane protein SpoIIM required for sporulation [Actinoplanes lutulentus]RAK26264.1 putative membrane protein SpoIIM required for sporulation [Actinoplanes lutulentus]
MDLDAYVLERAGEWDRMGQLARRRRLSAGEADELVTLYQRSATHLSVLRRRSPDPVVLADLSQQLMAGRAAINRGQGFAWRSVPRFFVRTFPAQLYQARRWWLGLGTLLMVAGATLTWYIAAYPEVAEHFLSPGQITDLVESDFVGYYSQYQPQNFASQVWTNNAVLTAQCIAAGVLILPVIFLLGVNLLNISLTGGVLVGAGAGDTFVIYLAPHGLLELTCVFIGAAVGLRIGWAWIAPGATRTRRQALVDRARSGMLIAIGLVPVLAVAGALEAYLTPSALPAAVRVTLGAAVWLAFLAYALLLGRAAQSRSVPIDSAAYELPSA